MVHFIYLGEVCSFSRDVSFLQLFFDNCLILMWHQRVPDLGESSGCSRVLKRIFTAVGGVPVCCVAEDLLEGVGLIFADFGLTDC